MARFLGALDVPFTYTHGAGSFTSGGFFGVCGRVFCRAAWGPVGPGPAEVRRPAQYNADDEAWKRILLASQHVTQACCTPAGTHSSHTGEDGRGEEEELAIDVAIDRSSMSGWPPSPFPPAASGPEDVTIRPTEAERDSGPSAATLAAAVGAVLGSGCCALHGCLRPDVTAALLPAARASLAELRAAAAAQPPTADGQRAPVDYAELLERSGGRVDARHRLHEPPFNSPDLVYNRLWYPLVASLLGDECCLLYMGVMWASANAPDGSDQPWHADGGHLYQHEHLPPHCLNVFVPLIDMEQAHGPTCQPAEEEARPATAAELVSSRPPLYTLNHSIPLHAPAHVELVSSSG